MSGELALGPVAQLSTAELLRFLLQVSTLLLLATGLGRLARRLGMPRVVGELLAGVLLGPSLLAHAWPDLSLWLFPRQPAQFHLLDAVAQLGVLLLVGLTGLQLDVTLLRQWKRTVFLVSSSGFVIPLAAGIGCGLLLPASLMADPAARAVFAGFIGVALAVSAVPVIAKTLADLEFLHRDIGQLILSSSVAEDSLGWLLLTVLTAIAVNGLHVGSIAIAIASIAGLIAVAVLSRPVFRVLLDWTSRSPDAGPTVALVIGVLLLAAASTQAMGFEGYLGAFVAGVVLASARIDHLSLAPLRSAVINFLAPVFFASAGL